VNKFRDRWRFVAESWFALSAKDQKEAGLWLLPNPAGLPICLRRTSGWSGPCRSLAQHKKDFWRATAADEQPIDDLHALSGNLQLVPIAAVRQALESDYTTMADQGCCAVSTQLPGAAGADQPAGGALQCHRAVPRLSSRGHSDPDRLGAGPSLVSVLRLILRFLASPGLPVTP
jgi:hypothetical protein